MKALSIEEIIKIIVMPGRYEIISNGNNSFIVMPLSKDALIITQEGHKEAMKHFRPSA